MVLFYHSSDVRALVYKHTSDLEIESAYAYLSVFLLDWDNTGYPIGVFFLSDEPCFDELFGF